jgi:protein arginine N-methyltransferase 5
LESATYEVFENDKIKYELYEEACFKAIRDKLEFGQFRQTAHLRPKQQDNEDIEMPIEQPEIIVLYFGAGRGPLIHRALNAAKRANATNVKVVALDKNPNAIVTLRNLIRDEKLGDRVKLISSDMRYLTADTLKGDILMSELLGSFGDNELSPECLIPTEKFLRSGGIFIPWSYTNHAVPLSSKVLWNEVQSYAQQGASANIPVSQQRFPYELPYVVKIYNATFPCGKESQDVFTFRHLPYPDDLSLSILPQGADQSLKQFGSLSFTVTEDSAEIHGFAGYFTAELY